MDQYYLRQRIQNLENHCKALERRIEALEHPEEEEQEWRFYEQHANGKTVDVTDDRSGDH